MKKMLCLLFIALSITACNSSQNECPDSLVARPDSLESGLMWGGDKAKVDVGISKVAAECIPVRKPVKEGSEKLVIQSYQVPVTAFFRYEIHDQKWFENATAYRDLKASMIFEVISKSGVVLGSSEGKIKIVSNNTSGSTSATIYLLPEEVSRIGYINARWEYGRD